MPRLTEAQLQAVEEFKRELVCPICHSQMVDPHSTECSHHFCCTCLHEYIHLHNECPECKVPQRPGSVTVNFPLGNLSRALSELLAVIERLPPGQSQPMEEAEPASCPPSQDSTFSSSSKRPAMPLPSTPPMSALPPAKRAKTPPPAPPTPTTQQIEEWRHAERTRAVILDENLRRIETASRRCLVPSMFKSGKQEADMQRLCTQLGADLRREPEAGVTTHIITQNVGGACAPTYKYFWGLSRGCWIVSFEWVSACLAAGAFVPEQPFEIDCANTDCGEDNLSALYRLDKALSRPLVFASVVCCLGPWHPDHSGMNREQTSHLLEGFGARLADKDAERVEFVLVGHPNGGQNHALEEDPCDFCAQAQAEFGGLPIVESHWVLVCVLAHRVTELGDWMLSGGRDPR